MNIADFRAQLEDELAWRTEEIRFFQNQCSVVPENDQDKFRRAMILLLYSNFEGFCKFSLSLYVSAVNAEGINCSQANSAIAAASLSEIFLALRDGTGKAAEFRANLPDDTKLHRFARDRIFIEKAPALMNRRVKISDEIIDTESNLKPVVLRKNLFRVGLPHDQFSEFEPQISQLLNIRNQIAHGETRLGVEKGRYESLRDSSLQVMSGIMRGVTQAFDERWFLAPQTGPALPAEAVAS